MARPICVVFADAFAYSSYQKLGGLGGNFKVKKIKPGVAYSSNLHYLLFDGKTPDDVGFFTDYIWERKPYKPIGKIKNICDQMDTFNNIYRVIRRKFCKKSDNIPFGEQNYFIHKGKYKFMEPGECTVFGQKVAKAYKATMEESFECAEQYVKMGEKGIVVVLEILDHTGHAVGSDGKEYMDYAQQVLNHTNHLFSQFKVANPNGVCVLISDHGMADVKVNVDILAGLKRRFGLPGKNYQVYNDSLYLRIWADDKGILTEIEEYLDTVDCMYRINNKERRYYGVTKKEFGELIYLLKEGYAFNPNCFGVSIRGGAAGLHGYMQPSDKASGILVTELLGEDMIDAMEVYKTVAASL